MHRAAGFSTSEGDGKGKTSKMAPIGGLSFQSPKSTPGKLPALGKIQGPSKLVSLGKMQSGGGVSLNEQEKSAAKFKFDAYAHEDGSIHKDGLKLLLGEMDLNMSDDVFTNYVDMTYKAYNKDFSRGVGYEEFLKIYAKIVNEKNDKK